MVTFTLKYVVKDQDRHGNIRFYFRRGKDKKIRLKGDFGSDEFMKAYDSALKGLVINCESSTCIKGSFEDICNRYYRSLEFSLLDVKTQNWRRSALNRICSTKGHFEIYKFQEMHIRRLRDDIFIETPAASRNRLNALKALFGWAVESGLIQTNPAKNVQPRKYYSEGHRTWTVEEYNKFIQRHPLGTQAYLAMCLMLYTAGRREDAVRLGYGHIRDGFIKFTQAKNEHRKPVVVEIPVTADLLQAIKSYSSGHMTFLVTAFGKPFSANGFGNKFREWCNQAGLPHCTAHGLRKLAAVILADSGCTRHEITSITGHLTSAEVDRYTKMYDKKQNAVAAIKKLEQTRPLRSKNRT